MRDTVPVEQCFIQGNSFYQQKKWDSAVHYYRLCVASHSNNATVYYNLGNSWYRLGKIGYAILSYKQALKRAPGYKAAADNLALAENRIPNRVVGPEPIFFQRWWGQLSRPDRAGAWAITGFIFFTLGIIMLLSRKMGRQGIYSSSQAIAIAFILWLCFIGLAFAGARREKATDEAVITASSATLRALADAQSGSLGKLPEGTVVTCNTIDKNWVNVSLPDGRTGWLAYNVITIVN